jgi:hypothetical protein
LREENFGVVGFLLFIGKEEEATTSLRRNKVFNQVSLLYVERGL